MPKKTYKIEHDWLTWEATVEIDEETAAQPMKEMVEFWSDFEGRLEHHDGNYTLTFVEMLGRELLHAVIADCSAGAIQDHFKDLEGWCAMDGSKGIRIVDVDDYMIQRDEFQIVEVKP